jgi:hypothetical protein
LVCGLPTHSMHVQQSSLCMALTPALALLVCCVLCAQELLPEARAWDMQGLDWQEKKPTVPSAKERMQVGWATSASFISDDGQVADTTYAMRGAVLHVHVHVGRCSVHATTSCTSD